MNSPLPLLSLATLLLFSATLAPLHAKPSKLELPLILQSERQQTFSPTLGRVTLVQKFPDQLSENCVYELVVIFGFLEKVGQGVDYAPKDYEPVGLHLDSDPDNIRPEVAGGDSIPAGTTKTTSTGYSLRTPETTLRYEFGTSKSHEEQSSSTTYSDWELSARIHHDDANTKTSGTQNRVPLHWMAESLALYSEKNVLVSARLEKRWCPEFRLNDSPHKNVAALEKLFAKEGVRLELIGDEAYVLIEASGREQPFPYSTRPRAAQYERERETWLAKNEDYIAQGLIYQPTEQSASALAKRDVRIRHAAAALAKLTGKEVFVQPSVEKHDFAMPKGAGQQESPAQEIELIARQLKKASVRIVELNPQALALAEK